MKKNEESIEDLTFEQAMSKMEKIVQRLEEGDVPLEEAIGLFQDGMQLSKTCHQKLKNVEEKMDQIIDEDGQTKVFLVQEDDES